MIASSVDEKIILLSDIKKFKQEIKQHPMLAQTYQISNPTSLSDKQALNSLIDEKIIEKFLQAKGQSVGTQDIENHIRSIAEKNNISVAEVEESLKRDGIPINIYKKTLKSQISRRKVFQSELRDSLQINDSEARKKYFDSASTELELVLITFSSKSKANAFLSSTKSKSTNEIISALKNQSAIDLGWTKHSELQSKIKTLLKDAYSGATYGTIYNQGQWQTFFVKGLRQGSEDGFEEFKQNYASKNQMKNINNKFSKWLEEKRKSYQVKLYI